MRILFYGTNNKGGVPVQPIHFVDVSGGRYIFFCSIRGLFFPKVLYEGGGKSLPHWFRDEIHIPK